MEKQLQQWIDLYPENTLAHKYFTLVLNAYRQDMKHPDFRYSVQEHLADYRHVGISPLLKDEWFLYMYSIFHPVRNIIELNNHGKH